MTTNVCRRDKEVMSTESRTPPRQLRVAEGELFRSVVKSGKHRGRSFLRRSVYVVRRREAQLSPFVFVSRDVCCAAIISAVLSAKKAAWKLFIEAAMDRDFYVSHHAACSCCPDGTAADSLGELVYGCFRMNRTFTSCVYAVV